MNDELTRLERLDRLRQSGAINDEEFEVQKTRILSSERSRLAAWKWAVPLAIIALAVLATLIVISGRGGSDSNAVVEQASSNSAESPAAAISNQTADAAPRSAPVGSLEWALSHGVIGLNPAYLEQRLGVPREKSANHMMFDVGGCSLYYVIERTEIISVSTNPTEECRPIVNGRRLTPATTFSAVAQAGGRYEAACLYMCGNAADPTIDYVIGGGRVSQYIETSYWSAEYEPQSLWEAAIRRTNGLSETEHPPASGIFMCATNPPSGVMRVLAGTRIEGVRIGRRLEPCSA